MLKSLDFYPEKGSIMGVVLIFRKGNNTELGRERTVRVWQGEHLKATVVIH